MHPRAARGALALIPIFVVVLTLAAACGSGGSSNKKGNSKTLSEPQNAPTATVPAALPSPIAASSVVGGGATGAAPDTYVVKAGDTLGGIASQLGVSVSDLAQANGITDPARIQVGQQLRIPRPGQTPGPAASPGASATPPLSPVGPAPTSASGPVAVPPTGGAPSGGGTPLTGATPAASAAASGTASAAAGEYTVRSGDTACSIARAKDISVAELAQANNMTKDQIARLSINQLLKIPAPTGHRDC